MELIMQEPEREARIHIEIGNEQPISAEALGRFIREIGADYRRTTGSTLVLSRLELGSTLMEFVDQAVLVSSIIAAPLAPVDAAERIGQLYNFLKTRLTGWETAQPELVTSTDASPARLLEIAAKSGANIKISRGKGDTKEVIELTHTQVSMQNALVKTRKRSSSKDRLELPQATRSLLVDRLSEAPVVQPQATPPLQIGGLSKRLREQVEAAPGQMEILVELFIEFLKSNGSGYQLSALAQDLESHGLYDMAAVVRRHIETGRTQQVTT